MESELTKQNSNKKENDYDILYIKICSKQTMDYINCIHNEPYGFKCDKDKLLKLFLKCQENRVNDVNIEK